MCCLLVTAFAQPFPLLVICDMMGIPRSEFDTVLTATNVILGGGDPEFMGDGDPLEALFTTEIPFVPLTFVEITNTLVPPEPAIDAAEAQLISVAFAAVQDQFAADGPRKKPRMAP